MAAAASRAYLCRDYTTVMHAYGKIKDLMGRDRDVYTRRSPRSLSG